MIESKELKKNSNEIKQIRKIPSSLIKTKEYLLVVYLFGSFAKNSENEKSDIDLAFVFNEKFYKEDPFRALQEAELLGAEINKKTNKAVDVVVLNGASLNFAYHVVREGIPIYEKRVVERIIYEVNLDNKYQDFIPFIKELRELKKGSLIGRD